MTSEDRGLPPRRGQAYGLEVHADFELAGLDRDSDRDDPRPAVVLERARRIDLDRGWGPRQATETFRREFPDGRPAFTIHAGRSSGYRIWIHRKGCYVVSPSGARISCAPGPRGRGRWDLLFAQALPIAAALQGLEVLHASAVVFARGAVAFSGPSGIGKTSLALALLPGGSELLTDDVLAVESARGGLMAHPGPAFARVTGAAGQKELTLTATVSRAVPLAGLCLLRRGPASAPPEVRRIWEPVLGELLPSTFVSHVAAAQRRITQLEIFSRIAREVPVYDVSAPSRPGGVLALSSKIRDQFR